jgi:hypothetical protein
MADNITLPGAGTVVATEEGSGGKHYQQVGVVDKTLVQVNPAMDETIVTTNETLLLLRRIARLLESSAVVDLRQRQRVVLDGISTGSSGVTTELAATLPVAASVVSGTGPIGTSLASGGQGPVVGAPTIATTVYQGVWEGPVDQRWRVMEDSHISYQLGVRNKLSWS